MHSRATWWALAFFSVTVTVWLSASSFLFHNYIGYDGKCGVSFVHNKSCVDYSIGRLIGEIRDRFVYVPGFDLTCMACTECVASSY